MERFVVGICAIALAVACGEPEPRDDAGLDSAVDVYHAPDAKKCATPEADSPPAYRWSFDQQTLLEDNGLIVLPPTSNTADHFEADDGLGCGEYFEETRR